MLVEILRSSQWY